MLIPIIQIILSVALTILILLQERSGGTSGLLGGGDGGGFYQARRGMQRVIFGATIVIAIVFAGLAVAELIWQ